MIEEKIWAGSETSLQAAIDGLAKLEASSNEDEPCDEPRLLSVADGLATITIKGPLVNMDHPMLRFFGMTGYPEIRDALVAAVNDPEVKEILLDIDSGGGQVALTTALADAITAAATYGTDIFVTFHDIVVDSTADGAMNATKCRVSDVLTIRSAMVAAMAAGTLDCLALTELAGTNRPGLFAQ